MFVLCLSGIFSANASMSTSTRKKKTFDPFACACYACVKAVFTMKLDLLPLVLASPMETRFKKCFDHLFYCINYCYFKFVRKNKSLPSIKEFNSKIKMIHQLETMIAKSNNKLKAHNMKWGKYKNS